MKQIINNKLYDTDTATLIYTVTSSDGAFIDALYKKDNGEYFMQKQYAPSTSLSLKPVTLQEAKDWVGTYAIDQYVGLFGAVSE